LAIQGILADPSSAGLEILGVLTGFAAKGEDDFEKLAANRRDISSDDKEKIGPSFQKFDTQLQGIVGHT